PQTRAASSQSAYRKRLGSSSLPCESVLPEAFPIKPSDHSGIIAWRDGQNRWPTASRMNFAGHGERMRGRLRSPHRMDPLSANRNWREAFRPGLQYVLRTLGHHQLEVLDEAGRECIVLVKILVPAWPGIRRIQNLRRHSLA